MVVFALRDTVAERKVVVGIRGVVMARDIVCVRVGVDATREMVAGVCVPGSRVAKFDDVRAVTDFVVSGVLDITLPERGTVIRSRTIFFVVGIDMAREAVVGALLFVSYAVFLRVADTVVWEF